MKQRLKKAMAVLCCLSLFSVQVTAATPPPYIIEQDSGENLQDLLSQDTSVWAPSEDLPTDAAALNPLSKGAVLMEMSTGQVLFEKDAHTRLPIASVTKIMTLLLIMEAIDAGRLTYEEKVTCSAVAASMGGSQIWLEEGETMTVDELLKAIAVVSANDACAMMAEHLCGTVEAFVQQMNERAAQLGMNDTLFLDCSGLNDEAYSCAADVAAMSRELMQHHPEIMRYTTIWMDSLRDGASQLVNTNKLVRHYDGATGLKTGTTAAAGHCLAATAKRGDLSLVAVVLGCETTDNRFNGARQMLDYGFANYTVYQPQTDGIVLPDVSVLRGTQYTVACTVDAPQPILLRKGEEKRLQVAQTVAKNVEAPVSAGQIVGRLTVTLDGKECGVTLIRAAQTVPRLSFGAALRRLFLALLA